MTFTGLELLTVRHYKNEEVEKLLKDKDVLLTQKNSKTIQDADISEDDLSPIFVSLYLNVLVSSV